MHLAAPILFFLVLSGFAGPAHAAPQRSCNLIESLVGLPLELQHIRMTQGDPTDFKGNLYHALNALSDARRTSVFTREELRAMRIFAGAVREDWKMNGIAPNGRQIAGLTKTSTTIQNQLSTIVDKFGCQTPKANPNATLWAAGNAPISAGSVFLFVLAFVILALGGYRLIKKRYQVKRRICRVPALLRHDGICTVTHIMDISRGGAMVEAPDGGCEPAELTVHITGHSIPARVAWANSNFLGLTFTRMLPAALVDEIVDMTAETDDVTGLTDQAPECFQPGCHRSCKTHIATAQSVEGMQAESASVAEAGGIQAANDDAKNDAEDKDATATLDDPPRAARGGTR